MNSIQRTAVYVLINVMAITMITSTWTSICVNAVTEDDGWVEGDDDSQGEISSQEELEDAYEGSEWEDDIGPNEFEEATDNDDDDNGNGRNGNDETVSPMASPVMQLPSVDKQSSTVNETRWYNNCEGGGKQAGRGLQFDTFAYENCEIHANGDKAYYDGFVQGCMGTDNANTKDLCEAYVTGCLRATSINISETCDVADDTSSSAWKLVMTVPIDCETWSADFSIRLADRC